MKPNQPQWGKAAGVFALGAAAGSTMALLYAPTSGRATRKRIALKFKSLKRSTVGLSHAAAEKLEDTRDWLMERIAPPANGRHPAPRRAHS